MSRYMKYREIKAYDDGITLNSENPTFNETFKEEYEKIIIKTLSLSNVRVYINNSDNYFIVNQFNNEVVLDEMGINSLKLELDPIFGVDNTVVQVILLR